jgi:hypothetical protein
MKPVKATKRTTKTSTSPTTVAKANPATVPSAPTPAPRPVTALNARTSTSQSSPPRQNGNASRPAPVTTIKANIDVGFGNNLFLRGQGAGLSWERGVPLTCVDGKTWQWTGKVEEGLTFKLLLNDQVWAKGEDLVAKPGQELEIVPAF